MFEKMLTKEHLFVYNQNGTLVLGEVVMKRRYVLKNRRRFNIFLVTLALILSVIVFAAAANGADSEDAYETVTIRRGDTLWDLAEKYCGNSDIRRYIEKIKAVNGMEDSTIYEGDIIKLPL
jgi:hypothetical protein